MAKYLLIESRDPFESNDVRYFYDLATELTRSLHEVTLFLIQNGALAARSGEHAVWFAELKRAGVEILADEFSLAERGITEGRLSPSVKATGLDVVIDRLGEGGKVLWH